MGKKKLLGGWYVEHQNRTEYYDSQQSALVGVDSILASSYESGVWSDKSHFYLGYKNWETVDTGLFAGRYSPSVFTQFGSKRFTVNVYTKTKEDWIFKYGSDSLRQSLKDGYGGNEGYLVERLEREYPGFTAKNLFDKYKKVDTPNEKCLYACSGYEHAYCSSIDQENYYITIDNYLGRYQLVKFIDPNLAITRVEPQREVIAPIREPIVSLEKSMSALVEVTNSKEEWVLEYGSDLLQQSLMAGYDCGDRYLQERIAHEYSGFEINPRNYSKVNSPDESCLYACLGYEDAYCSSNNASYYITIDNYLGKYQLIKLIDAPLKIAEESSIVQTAADTFSTKIRRYETLINSSPLALSMIASFSFIFVVSLFWISLFILLS